MPFNFILFVLGPKCTVILLHSIGVDTANVFQPEQTCQSTDGGLWAGPGLSLKMTSQWQVKANISARMLALAGSR